MNVLDKGIVIEVERAFVMVRKLGAIPGAHLVNAAFIVDQELAGLYFIDHIAGVFFFYQPLIVKGLWTHPEVGGNTFNIGLGKYRGHGFAAIGTGGAIRFFPYFRILFRNDPGETPGYCGIQLFEKTFQLFPFAGGFLFMSVYLA